MKLRKEEDKKAKKMAAAREEMKSMLAEQTKAKREKEIAAKKDLNQQAEMWKKERDLWQEEDARLKAKIKQINAET